MPTHHTNSVLRSAPASSTLYDVLDLILDKGLVVDVYARVSVIGIEVITIDARIVIASVDTYLRFAEAVNRLDIESKKQHLFGGEGGGESLVEKGIHKAEEVFSGGHRGQEEQQRQRGEQSGQPQQQGGGG